jgi:hypothetical protein
VTDPTWWQRDELERDRVDATSLAHSGLTVLAIVPAVILMALATIRTFEAPGLIAESIAGLTCIYSCVSILAGLAMIVVGLLRFRRISERLRAFDAPSPLPVARLVVRYARLPG